jgi:PleD family two-component response regulator
LSLICGGSSQNRGEEGRKFRLAKMRKLFIFQRLGQVHESCDSTDPVTPVTATLLKSPVLWAMTNPEERIPLPEQTPLRPPLVLIASDQEWSSRALESTLGPQGYAVLRAYNGRQALEHVERGHPDLVIISEHLPDTSGIELCRTLRAKSLVSNSTAIIVMVSGLVAREQRLAALRAGASDCCGLPLDGEEFGLRLMGYVRAKFDADQARDQGLIDHPTGLYNTGGLARRAREVGSLAYRHGTPLACVIIAPQTEGNSDQVTDAIIRIAEALNRDGRVSDVIGRVGPNEVAVFAPETHAEGAEKLVQRLQAAIQRRASQSGQDAPPLRTGYFAVPNFRDAPVEPAEMLRRASSSLRDLRTTIGAARPLGGQAN